MKIIRREPSNTLERTQIWTVQPDHIEGPFLVTLSEPWKRLPGQPLFGRMVLDGNALCGVAQFASLCAEAELLVPAALVVTIGYPLHSPTPPIMARNRELTPVEWPEWEALYAVIHGAAGPSGGGADAFLAFICDELKPTIEQEFGVDPGQWDLMGHSFGGLFAVHALLSAPTQFKRYFGSGSSFWWRNPLMFERAEAFVREAGELDVAVYLCAGEFETEYIDVMGGYPDIVDEAHRMAALLARRKGCRTHSAVVPKQTHGSAPLAALFQGLRWLHGR
jgi:predicted alpha/beta superfamily hydrolase